MLSTQFVHSWLVTFDANVFLCLIQSINRKVEAITLLILQQKKVSGDVVDIQVDQPLINADPVFKMNNEVFNLEIGK